MNTIHLNYSTVRKKAREGSFSYKIKSGERYDFILHTKTISVDVIECSSILFHHNSAITCLDDGGELIGSIISAYEHGESNPDKELIAFGHTDASGEYAYNYTLSELRAQVVKALLDNDVETWKRIAMQKSKTEDYQRTLKTLSSRCGWCCDPGNVDDVEGPVTKKAVGSFQEEYNHRYGKSITVDGIVGPQTWEAIFFVIRYIIVKVYTDFQEGEECPSLRYGYDGKGVYGCGESFCRGGATASNERNLEDRRVELIFHNADNAPDLIKPSDVNRALTLEECEYYDSKAVNRNDIPATPVDLAGVFLSTSLMAVIKTLSFNSSISAALNNNPISAPHWENGTNVNDGDGSLRAVVFKTGETCTLDVTIDITTAASNPGPLTLKGILGAWSFEGQCDNTIGEQTVTIAATSRPSAITRHGGDIQWRLSTQNGERMDCGRTRVEIFSILDDPAPMFDSTGVWIEVLRMLCAEASIDNQSTKRDAASAVSAYCHAIGYRYDTMRGAPHFGGSPLGNRPFRLRQYISNISSTRRVNCYDQAAAVQTMCGALGISLGWLFMQPYGYIHETNLIGIGRCNNPFFESNNTTPVIAFDDTRRTGFGNHAFTHYDTSANREPSGAPAAASGRFIIDSCAGPHQATETFDQYRIASIDTRPGPGGTSADEYPGITRVV
ncbi:MAG: peptidoglycan-binding protein [Chitinispirillaceae bacterium]